MLYEQIKVVCARRIFAGALPRLIGAAGPVTEGDEYEKSKFRSCYRLPPRFPARRRGLNDTTFRLHWQKLIVFVLFFEQRIYVDAAAVAFSSAGVRIEARYV